ncbi:type VI secretion system baseplate subunit TssG [Halorhodospira halophila]|uniref:Type VI secretion protein, VC_A0111 family n=1 Tax=Halorhodospira halophila (strain DSM 244 / SL1) TaxID=349124 RepID=A1WTD8_HALHL|nr:type VI secretion system baseplate subunit TssG [Halorhodospira halophila]ABM60950.1 conserved hypothetical protein [Halorhodospira halophila SL1]
MATTVTAPDTAVAHVVARGPRLRLCEAVWALEHAGLTALAADEPGPGYHIEPAADWTFPAAEIRRCRQISERRVAIEANVLALLGPEAPLPSYWLEAAAREDPTGERVQGLLRMLNASVYAALLAGWRAMHGPASSAPWAQALAAFGVGSGGGLSGLDLFLARRPNRSGLCRLVQRVTGQRQVEVVDRQPVVHPLGPFPLGQGHGPRLGEGWGLGGMVRVAGGLLGIRIGPLAPATATGLIEEERFRRLGLWLSRYLGPVPRVEVQIMAAPGRLPAWRLGAGARLGGATWLGRRSARAVSLPLPGRSTAPTGTTATGETQ